MGQQHVTHTNMYEAFWCNRIVFRVQRTKNWSSYKTKCVEMRSVFAPAFVRNLNEKLDDICMLLCSWQCILNFPHNITTVTICYNCQYHKSGVALEPATRQLDDSAEWTLEPTHRWRLPRVTSHSVSVLTPPRHNSSEASQAANI